MWQASRSAAAAEVVWPKCVRLTCPPHWITCCSPPPPPSPSPPSPSPPPPSPPTCVPKSSPCSTGLSPPPAVSPGPHPPPPAPLRRRSLLNRVGPPQVRHAEQALPTARPPDRLPPNPIALPCSPPSHPPVQPQGNCCASLFCVADSGSSWTCASTPATPDITAVTDGGSGGVVALNFTYTESDNGAASLSE